MQKQFIGLAAILLLSACSNMTQYETQVENWEPVYCYKSIGAVQCYKEPKHSDSRRLVNFYGPAPSTYDAPDEPDYAAAKAPKMIDYWVKDAEPVPLANLPRVAAQAEAANTTAQVQEIPEDEDVSLMDGIMRTLFGTPELANKPVLVRAAPGPQLQPAPAAQPVIPVQTGTL